MDISNEIFLTFQTRFNNIFSDENIDKIVFEIKNYLLKKEYILDVHYFSSSFAKNLHHMTIIVENEDDIAQLSKEFDRIQS